MTDFRMPTLAATALVFIILKFADSIDWSWWWVLLPSLVGLALTLCLSAIISLCRKQ